MFAIIFAIHSLYIKLMKHFSIVVLVILLVMIVI